MAGRKSKLTKERQKAILTAIAQGNYVAAVCVANGISPTTYFSWLERGRHGESPYLEFLNAVTRAEQRGQVKLVSLIHSHAERDWRAAAFLLERRHRKDWGRHETIDATLSTQRADEIERRLFKGREANAGGETR